MHLRQLIGHFAVYTTQIRSREDVTVRLAGDYRFALPVIPKGTKADEVTACLKRSYLLPNKVRMELSKIVRARLHGDESAGLLANTILDSGSGKIELHPQLRLFQIPCGNVIHSMDMI